MLIQVNENLIINPDEISIIVRKNSEDDTGLLITKQGQKIIINRREFDYIIDVNNDFFRIVDIRKFDNLQANREE